MADIHDLCARLTEETTNSTSTFSSITETTTCARMTDAAEEPCSTASDSRRQHKQSRRGRRRFGFDSMSQTPEPILPLTALPANLLFNTLRVEDKIGEGRFGTVWRCVHPKTGAQFACKQVDKRTNAKALRREVECLTRVQGNPHVLSLEGVYESELYLYIVTELCNAGDLFEYLSKRGPLPEADARALFAQLAEGMSHCHSRGVMHRDIKPENVLLNVCPKTGQITAKLADFGLSKKLSKGEMTVGWVGSDPYEAPEVVALKPYDFSADVFSMGVLLFGMLSGTWPTFLEGRVFDEVSEFAWPGWCRMSRGPKDLIASMLSHEPVLRPNMAQVVRDSWLCGTVEEDFTLVIERLMRARKAAQAAKNVQRAQQAQQARESNTSSGVSVAEPVNSLAKIPAIRALQEAALVSQGSMSEFSWAGSEQSTPRVLSEDEMFH